MNLKKARIDVCCNSDVFFELVSLIGMTSSLVAKDHFFENGVRTLFVENLSTTSSVPCTEIARSVIEQDFYFRELLDDGILTIHSVEEAKETTKPQIVVKGEKLKKAHIDDAGWDIMSTEDFELKPGDPPRGGFYRCLFGHPCRLRGPGQVAFGHGVEGNHGGEFAWYY